MKRKPKYFKIGDILIYGFFILFFAVVGLKIKDLDNQKASRVEIYVDGKLKYTYPLQKEEKDLFVDTNLGGVNVKFRDNMVRVTSSNSPLKINVKRGWIQNPGEVIIGIPDRLVIKVVGDKEADDDLELDYIVR
ncbi:NusG domain II-containing protein [Fusobacterium sp.]|uniref:NusG domain II-containing protein n=1 Tax=Fusobacterium sp. TaxID=68766 RepID=UPI00396CE11B